MTTVVLVVAAGAAWEAAALTALDAAPGVVVLKRCVDVDDLLATAAAGQADAALVALDAPGLDAAAVDHLRSQGVRVVGVVPTGPAGDAGRLRAARLGIGRLVADGDLAAFAPALTDPEVPDPGAADLPELYADAEAAPDGFSGRVLAVWGPAGAPGRTTLAAAVAAELAHRGLPALLVDADPYGGAIAQQLGILDEVSGLLSAARLAVSGDLADRFATVPRTLGPHLGVVTGLPRPDRWLEVRSGVLEQLVECGRRLGYVVVDTGFSLEDDPGDAGGVGLRPPRNLLTHAAIDLADEVLVVGTPDPVGLTRLARGLVELAERAVAVRVVVNRMRPGVGWGEDDIAAMVAGLADPVGLHFLPEDRATADRALVAGRTLLETAPGAPLPRAVADLVDLLAPEPAAPGSASGRAGRLSRRRAGRGHRR